MTDVRTADWSEEVAPFWKAVIQTALSGAGFAGLLRAGWTTIKVICVECYVLIKREETLICSDISSVQAIDSTRLTVCPCVCIYSQGALVMPLMAQGFSMGLIKFNLITATKAPQ